jgi:predicted hydrocarbon binding protein
MNGQTEFVYYYPNRVGRIIFQAMQEVIGHNELNVEETLCIAKGDATCTIDIDKETLD